MHAFDIIVVSVCGYLIGSIPFAVIIGKIHGINILEVGSGSPGATNIKRSIESNPLITSKAVVKSCAVNTLNPSTVSRYAAIVSRTKSWSSAIKIFVINI